ncbi:2-oxoglutarate ferredoxin oxidoreductase subunit alpha [Methanofollis sp. W23]|uniref:2-oxoacid:acceptor oxidoreductase subunit alpha n=1 Tax=Methanofollis sp. W23 TaxID=2817849 RepID=UPI001AE1238B|nr:2-oxoacid:acceptor oxidoreductase subunit alpha [Methanofollis sp. W23]MBP2146014.1 2-oxoglutarate ferredoxin oxidoreductase subunit alpha [Methanofollis sp. W23]
MDEIAVLIGGKAGEGINIAGSVVMRLIAGCGLRAAMYYDYQSLIKGGHNFAVIRGAAEQPYCHREGLDLVLALDQETVRRHHGRLRAGGQVIYDTGRVQEGEGTGIPLDEIVKDEGAPAVTRNMGLIGGFCKACAIPWETVEAVLSRAVPKAVEANLRVAGRGYEAAEMVRPLPARAAGIRVLPAISGNEAIALGLVEAGLEGYIAYPMTPSSGILHFLAARQEEFRTSVVHPENEIGVMLMALGAAYAGRRVAVGTSGGGFCLMTEGFSLAGMAELPVLIVLAQRPGPSTGVPTYSGQGDLLFALSAGQGEFPRPVVAPGTLEEAWYWAGALLDLAWRFQTPAVLLTDKNLGEGMYTFHGAPERPPLPSVRWDGDGGYRRYAPGPDGVSPLASPGTAGAVVKVNSYAHDERGITTEDRATVARMAEKRNEKEKAMAEVLRSYPSVMTAGDPAAGTVLLCWGSTAGVCTEAAKDLGLRVVRPVVLSPFPVEQFSAAIGGAEQVVAVEENLDGHLARLVRAEGYRVNAVIGKYDGRPFFLEDLERQLKGVGA